MGRQQDRGLRVTSGRNIAHARRQPRLSRALVPIARTLAFAAFAAALSFIFFAPGVRMAASATIRQRQRPPRPSGRAAAPRQQTARDYSRFSHSSTGHARRDCASCHRLVSFEKPDIADFPDHPACVECHRQQFFRGARPAICSICHVNVSPRSGARPPFPKPTALAEFADVFPHANHIKTTSLIQFKKVIGEKSNIQATCLYCHKPNAATPPEQLTQPPTLRQPPTHPPTPTRQGASAAAFVAPAGTFMTTPTSHANCFECHWQKDVAGHEQEPYATQCASCHRNVAAGETVRAEAIAPFNVATSRDAPRAQDEAARTVVFAAGLASSPFLTARTAAVPPRIVPKFVHEIDAHKKRMNDEGREVAITCLQCHAAVRKAATLESLRLRENAVGLQTCSSSACHTATTGAAQLHLSVYRELRERARDARFDCTLCHTPPRSLAADVPCTHYATVFAGATKEKKGTKGIEQLTPPRCAEDLKREAR